MNIAEVLWSAAEDAGDAVALEMADTGEQLTYRELCDLASGAGQGFLGQGLVEGDRVAILLRNSPDYVVAFFGALAAGLIVVPLNVRLTDADFEHMIRDSGTRLVVTEAEFLPRLGGLDDADGLRILQVPVQVPVPSGTAGDFVPRPTDSESPCSLMYTSGTTGAPKAVVLSHRSWLRVSDAASTVLEFRAADRIHHTAPLTHGAGFLLLPTIAARAVNVVHRTFEPSVVADAIAGGTLTGTFLVPSMIRLLLDAAPDGWQAHPHVRWLYYAGSPIDPDTFREATDAFPGRLVQSYAQMESPMFFTVLDQQDHARAVTDGDARLLGSAGHLLPGVHLAFVDALGDPAAPGEAGEILARAPQTMIGYWNRPDATAVALRDGWLHTGDVGYLDDGYLFVVDRVKDMIVSGGSNVYAREVEKVIEKIPGIAEVAVVGLPHRVWGEAVAAVVVAEHERVADSLIVDTCRGQLADYKVPKSVFWVEALPRNAYGKVLKRQLRDSFSSIITTVG